jgi:RNA polymerase sigma factor (sigma-70 family)
MTDVDVTALVAAAGAGERDAWDELVRRFGSLVWAVARSFRLSQHDAEDVSQTVWLLLASHIGRLRDPEALPGWLATATRRESLRVARRRQTEDVMSDAPGSLEEPPDQLFPQPEEVVLRAELRREVRAAFARLSQRCRALLSLLAVDPPATYRTIALALDMPMGSIGPIRARCLDTLRRLTRLPDTSAKPPVLGSGEES